MNTEITISPHRTMPAQPMDQVKVGNHICERMNQLLAAAYALKTISEFASKHGNRTITAGVTLATGIGFLSHGNLVAGGIATLSGVKEAINIWKATNQTTDLSSLLNDANAGVDMVKTLNEANNQSFKLLKSNLTSIKKNVQKMNSRMEEIKSLSIQGQEELDESKTNASSLLKQAKDEFDSSKSSFKTAQNRFDSANAIFIQALGQFDHIFEIAKDADLEDKDKLATFIKVAKRIQRQCKAAQTLMLDGNAKMDKGLASLDSARDKEQIAFGEYIAAMERAKSNLKLIEAQAKVKKEYETKVDEAQNELAVVQERNKDIKTLLDELSGDLQEANQLCEGKLGTMSIMLGVIPGTVAGFCAMGGLGAVAGGATGGAVVHNRGLLFEKVDNLINGKVSYINTNPSIAQERVSIKFRSRSTGWFNRFIAKLSQSYTVGIVDIKVGDETVSFNFNLNNKNKIKKSDLFHLQSLLAQKVSSNKISEQECLNILSELETKHIDRGSKQPQKGFISSKSSYLSELKRICHAMIAKRQALTAN